MIERIDVNEKIMQALEEGKRNIILYAPGGYGKTKIAEQINAMRGGDKNNKDIIRAGNADIHQQLVNLYKLRFDMSDMYDEAAAKRLERAESIQDDGVFAHWLYLELDAAGSEWCVVFDDLSRMKPDEMLSFVKTFNYCPKKEPKGMVIFTTQRYTEWIEWDDTLNIAPVKVGSVEEDTAERYLRENLPGITDNDIGKIFEATDRIVLPLSMAVVAIARKAERKAKLNRRRAFEEALHDAAVEYCNEVCRRDAEPCRQYDNKNLYISVELTAQYIKEESVDAYDLMICCAMTEPRGILEGEKFIDRLGFKSAELELNTLNDWLIFEENSLAMHPTTQDVLLQIDEANNRCAYCSRLIKTAQAFTEMFKDEEKDVVKIWYDDATPTNVDNENELGTALRLLALLEKAAENCRNNPDHELGAFYSDIYESHYEISYAVAYYFWFRKMKYDEQEKYYGSAYRAICDLLECSLNDDEARRLRYNKAAQLSYRGVALRQLDRNEEAMDCFGKVLEIYGKLPEGEASKAWHSLAVRTLYNRGLARSDAGNNDAVLDDYNKSIKIAEENGIAPYTSYRCIGIFFRDTGEYDQAVEMFDKSIELSERCAARDDNARENTARCYTNLGLLYPMRGNYENGVEHCTRAIELHPIGNAAAIKPLLNKEWSLRKLGRFDEAKSCLSAAALILLGDDEGSPALALERILDGCTSAVDLKADDWHWKNIECMFLCTHSVRFLLARFARRERDKNIEMLIELAFRCREEGFTELRRQLLALADVAEDRSDVNEDGIRSAIAGLKFNKLACAVLMFTCSEYYSACGEMMKALAFAYAAYYLYGSYNYAYGIKETERHISELKGKM